MKKWVQKTAGLILSVFLAMGLGAKVRASDEEEALPAPAPTEVSEPAPAAPEPAQTAPAAESPKPTESAPAAEPPRPAESAPAAEAPKPAQTAPAAESPKPAESAPAEEPPKPVESAPAAEALMPAEAAPIEAPTPAEAPAPVEVPAPVEEPAPVEDPAPVEAPAPVEEPAPAGEPASVEEPSPAGEPAPVEEPAPADEPAPVGVPVPAMEPAPVEEPSPAEEPAPVSERSPEMYPEADDPVLPLDADPISEDETILLFDEQGEPLTETVSVSVRAMLKGGGQSSSSITVGGKDVSLQDGWTWDKSAGCVGLINYNHPDVNIVSSGLSGLTIAAAGYNRLHSISSEGNVNITGTGLLLVDNVTLGTGSGFYLHTPTDIYNDGTGSVAVFLKTGNNQYTLVNGSIAGLLDEQYTVKDVNLVVPNGSTLLLNSGGTIYRKDTGEIVERYTGDEDISVDTHASDFDATYGIDETFASLTLSGSASLTVQSGGTVKMVGTPSKKPAFPPYNAPVLTAADSSTLTVNGRITGDGEVDLGADSSLSGSGRVEAREIGVDSHRVLKSSGVTFRSDIVVLNGTGSIPRLSIENSAVFLADETADTTIGELTNSGESRLTNDSQLTIKKLVNSGTLLLGTNQYFADGDDDCTRLAGPISGGTLRLTCGFFRFLDGFSLKNGAALSYGNVVVYDETGSSGTFSAPLLVSSDRVTRPAPDGDSCKVPLIVINASGKSRNDIIRELYRYTDTEVVSAEESEIIFHKNSEGKYVADLGDPTVYPGGVIPVHTGTLIYHSFELFCMDSEGRLYSQIITRPYYDTTTFPVFELVDAYLVRICNCEYTPPVLPASSIATASTSFTGTGILGGSGSLNGGSGSLILFGSSPAAPSRRLTEAPQTDWHVIVSPRGRYYTVRVYFGDREVTDPGRKMTARMKFTLPAGWNRNDIYAVFRNADGSLTAIRAAYDEKSGTLSFDTDLTGTFALISFPFDGKPYSEEFYDAISELEDIRLLPVRR